MSKKSRLNEVFKISIEVDGENVSTSGGGEQLPQIEKKQHFGQQTNESAASDGGYFGKYVNELARGSDVYGSLSEVACDVNRLVSNSLDDLAIREDKREYNAGVTKANENVLRSWRSFIRELAKYEKRFIG